jgi:hypothetical protein
MKFATIVLFMISTLSLILSKRSRKSMRSMVSQNFRASCNKIQFAPPKYLTANCKDNKQVEKSSRLDLDTCFMNFNGKLAIGAAFTKSCSRCSLSGLTTLNCECLDKSNKKEITSIDVNTVVNNNGGKLECKHRRR